jgi:small conductance mechanosensitive channel
MTTDNFIGIILNIAANIGLAALVLLLGQLVARLLRRFVRRLLERPQVATALGPSIVRLLGEATYYIVFALAIGLSIVALGVPATYVVTGAAVLLVIFGVALQQSLANFAATVIFLLFQPFRRDELIETMGQIGTVKEILFFNTVLELGDKKVVSLPNSKIQDYGIVNYSRMQIIRADVVLTVTYDADIVHVREVLNDIAAADKRILADPAFGFIVDDLGDNGMRLSVRPWVATEDYWNVRNDLRETIKARFDAEGIAFALPQLDVHVIGDRREFASPSTGDGTAREA